MDVVLDLFGENLDLGVEESVLRRASLDVIDQHLGTIMLDIGLFKRVSLDLAFERGIENLFLDERVDFELGANLVGQRLLAVCGFGTLELLEQILDLAVIGLQQGDSTLVGGHGKFLRVADGGWPDAAPGHSTVTAQNVPSVIFVPR